MDTPLTRDELRAEYRAEVERLNDEWARHMSERNDHFVTHVARVAALFTKLSSIELTFPHDDIFPIFGQQCSVRRPEWDDMMIAAQAIEPLRGFSVPFVSTCVDSNFNVTMWIDVEGYRRAQR